MKTNGTTVRAHLALLLAGSMWGLMSPVGKLAMDAGISGLSLAFMRIAGAAACFWLASLFAPRERVGRRDLLLLFFAGLLGVVFNQGLFIIGLSLTSPVDSTVITTSLPIITMLLAAAFMKEPVTPVKVTGVVMGAAGALILVLGNRGGAEISGNVWGDILCLTAQISFACYLTVFKSLILRYHTFTLMKWMFLWATVCFLPFSFHDLSDVLSRTFPLQVWLEVAYVVLCGTFLAYILILSGQRTLRPTIVSMYNYAQPVVGTCVSVLIGIGTFGWIKAFASVLIFTGVYVVTRSRSRGSG
ncbi:MAG: DMT family transporter [Tannerella sp.]|jgi:drug/metabolite transporter (DMT)-like permease|nr:DMT family transporter [Tannerella sp.]